jgi:carbamoyltransferase
MWTLGISCYFHDSAAALLRDGVLVAAAEEERFTRKKHDYGFPDNAIRFCLEYGGISGRELDHAVFFEKPFLKFDRLLKTSLQSFPRSYLLFVQSMRTWLSDKLWVKSHIARTLGLAPSRILFSDHHLSHAASAYYCSPFEESAVLTFDGVGEWATTTMGSGRGRELELTRELHFPHSLGLLYSAFTAFLGFEVNEGEYKVMGMAPYGQPRYADRVYEVLHLGPQGSFALDPRYFSFHYGIRRPYTRRFLRLFGEPRDPSMPFVTRPAAPPPNAAPASDDDHHQRNEYYADIAASVQLVTEDLVLGLAREAHRATGSRNLCLAGGVALNSVANGRILRETPFQGLYVQPSAGDGGGALGAALVAWHGDPRTEQRFVMDHPYWGKAYTDEETREALDAAGVDYRHVAEETQLLDEVVRRLVDGQVIGWFQGRFEWGPRALGNRSILADPRRPDMKDIVNAKIKFREPFRPFAPSVLAEVAEEYFELGDARDALPARFMLLVVPVREAARDTIPAVNHMGTARPQLVHKESNPLFHELIRRFGDSTGVPVLLNTSYNVRGEPIVNSPSDALRTFAVSGLDATVLGRFIVSRKARSR